MFTGNYLVIVKQFKSEPAQYGLGINFNVLLLLLFYANQKSALWYDAMCRSLVFSRIKLH